MMYEINSRVKIKKDDTIKMVVDAECILDTNVYYMSDNTSYGEHQISFEITKEYEELINKITPNFVVTKLLDIDKVGENMSNWYKLKQKQYEKPILPSNSTNTSWLRKILSYLS